VKFLPPLTRLIVLVNCTVAVYSVCLDWFGRPDWVGATFALTYQGWVEGEWWRLFGYMWLHAPWEGAGIFHLVFNMITLVMLGGWLERRLGAVRYVFLYLLGGVAAGLCFLLEIWLRLHLGLAIPEVMDGGVVGASGSIAALFGAFVVLFPEIFLWVLLIPWPVRANRAFWIFIAASIAFMFIPSLSWMAHGAHLGGAFAGYLLLRWGILSCPPRSEEEALMGQGVWEEAALRGQVDAMNREELIRAFSDMEQRWQSGGRSFLTDRDRLVIRKLAELLRSEDR
jgi:membrane associated rhomboid family serine protease